MDPQSTPQSLMKQRLAALFFTFSVAVLTVAVIGYVQRRGPAVIDATQVAASEEAAPAGTTKVAARGPVDVFTLTRTPVLDVGQHHFQILGLGQNAATGEQLVWVRSLVTNRVAGFAEGARLFDTDVEVQKIAPTQVAVRQASKLHTVTIEP